MMNIWPNSRKSVDVTDRTNERHRAEFEEDRRRHPLPPAHRMARLKQLEERAARLDVVARDLRERTRSESKEYRELVAMLERRQRDALPDVYEADPRDLEAIEQAREDAERLAGEAEKVSTHALAARQVAKACRDYLYPQKAGAGFLPGHGNVS